MERKRKYDEVVNLQIVDDRKLTAAQLRSLLNMKKRKNDRPISSMKKVELLYLWTEWKHRPNEPPQYENELVESVNEAPALTHSTNTDNETTMLNDDHHMTISI